MAISKGFIKSSFFLMVYNKKIKKIKNNMVKLFFNYNSNPIAS